MTDSSRPLGSLPNFSNSAEIQKAAAIIKTGGLIIFPTRGLYGIGADVFNPEAVARVFALKNRPADKPLLALISHHDMLSMLVPELPPMAKHLMQRFWPGKVTFVLEACRTLPTGLCSAEGKIGVRWVAHPVAAALVAAVGRPITGTSANLSGAEGCAAIDDIPDRISEGVDMCLNSGPLAGGPGSTVVDVTGAAPRILRQGALSAEEIMAALSDL